MAHLTGKQCKTARLLLKWNVRELGFRTAVKPNQIDLFERGQKQLLAHAKEQLVKVFKKEGIEFLEHGEVRLDAGDKTTQQGSGSAHVVHTISHEEYQAMQQPQTERKRRAAGDGDDSTLRE